MKKLENYLPYLAFTTALLATIGSLYFSEILHLPPCSLCWYQRIFIYPLVFVLGTGIIRKDAKVYSYVLPLSFFGMAIAVYHNLLYYGFIPEQYAPCTAGVSCTEQLLTLYGFITIPLLSLLAFSIISASMIMLWKGKKYVTRN